MHIQILKWDKHNPRADYKSLPWFRCMAGLYRDRRLFKLSAETKWTFVCLLCLAAEENKGGLIEGDVEWLADQLKFPEPGLSQALEALASKQLIEITFADRTSDVREPDAPRSLRTNERNERNEHKGISAEPSPLSLVQLWNTKKSATQAAVKESTFTAKSGRWKTAKARLSEQPDLGYWEQVVGRVAASPFCNGKNERGWLANFDFLVRPDTHARAMEGQYGGAPAKLAVVIPTYTEADGEKLY